jgi:hypothetical protein
MKTNHQHQSQIKKLKQCQMTTLEEKKLIDQSIKISRDLK